MLLSNVTQMAGFELIMFVTGICSLYPMFCVGMCTQCSQHSGAVTCILCVFMCSVSLCTLCTSMFTCMHSATSDVCLCVYLTLYQCSQYNKSRTKRIHPFWQFLNLREVLIYPGWMGNYRKAVGWKKIFLNDLGRIREPLGPLLKVGT